MTFNEFKKKLIDADLTLPKFAKLISVSEKNIQNYKKKEKIPNHLAVIVECFAIFKEKNIDFEKRIDMLKLRKNTKKGVGFQKNPENSHSKKRQKEAKE